MFLKNVLKFFADRFPQVARPDETTMHEGGSMSCERMHHFCNLQHFSINHV